MARSPRLVEAGTVIHVANRGAGGAPIFRDDSDRFRFLTLYAAVARRYDWRLLAFCLMTNHYHLLIEPRTAALSKGMQMLNGQYAAIFNDRHARRGCLFQGRFWSARVHSERYLHAVVRYIGLNPVTAGLCADPDDWRWGGHRELAGLDVPRLVDVDRTLTLLASSDVADHRPYRALLETVPDPLSELAIRSGAELSWDEVKREVARMRREGCSVPTLARAIGRDPRTVRRWLVNAGGDIRAMTSGSDPDVTIRVGGSPGAT